VKKLQHHQFLTHRITKVGKLVPAGGYLGEEGFLVI